MDRVCKKCGSKNAFIPATCPEEALEGLAKEMPEAIEPVCELHQRFTYRVFYKKGSPYAYLKTCIVDGAILNICFNKDWMPIESTE